MTTLNQRRVQSFIRGGGEAIVKVNCYGHTYDRSTNASFGEDFLCMLVTGRHMHVEHTNISWNTSHLTFRAGYDFEYSRKKVEVKTYGRDGMEAITRQQLLIADVFMFYNLSGRMQTIYGHDVKFNHVLILPNRSIRNFQRRAA